MIKKKVLYGIIIISMAVGIIYLFLPFENNILIDKKHLAVPGLKGKEHLQTPPNSIDQRISIYIEAGNNSVVSLLIFNDSEYSNFIREVTYNSLYNEENKTLINVTIPIVPSQPFIHVVFFNEEADQYLNVTLKISFNCKKYQYNWSIFSFSVSGVIFIYLIYKKNHQFQPSR